MLSLSFSTMRPLSSNSIPPPTFPFLCKSFPSNFHVTFFIICLFFFPLYTIHTHKHKHAPCSLSRNKINMTGIYRVIHFGDLFVLYSHVPAQDYYFRTLIHYFLFISRFRVAYMSYSLLLSTHHFFSFLISK